MQNTKLAQHSKFYYYGLLIDKYESMYLSKKINFQDYYYKCQIIRSIIKKQGKNF